MELVLPAMALPTMVIAGVCALGVPTVRRIMGFVLIAHVGYLLMGIALGTATSLGATLLTTAQEMFVIAGLYTFGAVLERTAGTDDLRALGGGHAWAGGVSGRVFILIVAAAGLPPTSAFFGKALLVREGVETGNWALTTALLMAALLILLAMLRIWCGSMWRLRESGQQITAQPTPATLSMGLWVFAGGVVLTSVGAGVLTELCIEAGEHLVRPEAAVDAVLGEGAWPLGASGAESEPGGVTP